MIRLRWWRKPVEVRDNGGHVRVVGGYLPPDAYLTTLGTQAMPPDYVEFDVDEMRFAKDPE